MTKSEGLCIIKKRVVTVPSRPRTFERGTVYCVSIRNASPATFLFWSPEKKDQDKKTNKNKKKNGSGTSPVDHQRTGHYASWVFLCRRLFKVPVSTYTVEVLKSIVRFRQRTSGRGVVWSGSSLFFLSNVWVKDGKGFLHILTPWSVCGLTGIRPF